MAAKKNGPADSSEIDAGPKELPDAKSRSQRPQEIPPVEELEYLETHLQALEDQVGEELDFQRDFNGAGDCIGLTWKTAKCSGSPRWDGQKWYNRHNGTVSLTSTDLSSDDISPGPVLINLADVEPEDVEFLWPGRIAIGKLCLICGNPSEGKSFLTLDIAARVSTGRTWPDLPGGRED